MVKSISDKLSINILCNELFTLNKIPSHRYKQKKTHNPRSPPEEMSDTPHGDTNSGRTGSGVEANAIGC